MRTVRNMLEAFKTLDIEAEIPRIIESDSEILLDKNRDQLTRGKTSKDTEVAPGYFSLVYSMEKQRENPLAGFGVPDLKLTGAFYNGFNIKVTASEFTIDSSDSKTSKLEGKYGQIIFGLTPSSKTDYATKEFITKLQAYISSKTGVQFR